MDGNVKQEALKNEAGWILKRWVYITITLSVIALFINIDLGLLFIVVWCAMSICSISPVFWVIEKLYKYRVKRRRNSRKVKEYEKRN